MNTSSILTQELAPLNAQIEQIRQQLETLEGEMRGLEAELQEFSADKQRFDALQEVCEALDRLDELGAGGLFWEGTAADEAAGHVARLRERVSRFEGENAGVLQKQQALKARSERHREDLDYLYEEVREAYAREERRLEEFVVEREVSPPPFRRSIMPWSTDGETERRFRRALLIALFWSCLFGVLVPLVNLPIPDRTVAVPQVPERLAMLVKKELPKPPPVPQRPLKAKKSPPEEAKAKNSEKPRKAVKESGGHHHGRKHKAAPAAPRGGGGTRMARRKAERSGVLAFKSSFKDLMKEVPVAKLGTEARRSKKAAVAKGHAVASRALVAMEGSGGSTSGGISNFGISRNLGSGGGRGGGNGIARRISGVGFTRVRSAVAGIAEEARPLSDGPGPGRTDEEIQIVFDRYKAALYRIYNRELRKDPTLRGKILLRLTIEPNGKVSFCKAESTDLTSPELVAKVVARVKLFNFGSKEGVPKTTILYPIDFLPAT